MISKQHKQFFRSGLKFLIIFLIVDFSLGYVTKKIFYNQNTGKFARLTHVIDETEAELLLFGSSYVNRQFVPEVFQSELNLSTYNAGVEGQHLIFHTALQKIVLNRYNPKLIVLNINPEWLYESQNAYDKLSVLHPYYYSHKETLAPILSQNSSWINFKLLLKGYQTNSTLVHIIKYVIIPQKDYNGYRPLYGAIDPAKLRKSDAVITDQIFDQNFVKSLNDFIDNAKEKNCELIFTTSPTLSYLDLTDDQSFNTIKAIAKKENIPFIDFINNEVFLEKYKLFSDKIHLNDEGSRLFCKYLSEEIKIVTSRGATNN